MLGLTTKTVLWDEKKSTMEMEVSLTPTTVSVGSFQAPVSPFSLESPESIPSSSPAKQTESVSTGNIIINPPYSKKNLIKTNTKAHLTELTELAADLVRTLSYTEGYGPDCGKQTQQENYDIYELQTLSRRHSIRTALSDVADSTSCSPRPISRKVRAERRARRYALI